MAGDELLTVEEVAEILKLSAYKIRELCKKGELSGFKLGDGRQWRIQRADLEDYINRQRRR